IAKEVRALGAGGGRRGAGGDGRDVAVGDEDVEQAIVVKIQKTGAPGKERNRRIAEAGAKRHVGKICAAIIAIERFVVVGKRGDEKVEFAIAIVIAHADAHGSLRTAFFIDGKAAEVADVFEGAVVAIAIEVVGRGIVGDEEIEPAVIVETTEARSETVAPSTIAATIFDANTP